MKVWIRADASINIGSGHTMRCITLATLLRKRGHEVEFFTEDLPGNMNDYLVKQGYPVYFPTQLKRLPKTDWLIVDHYGLDIAWESAMRSYARQLMVIDDLANRQHDCDVLLDQNFYYGYKNRYDMLVSPQCQKLLGPQYTLLREEFLLARQNLKVRDGRVQRILVFFGGSDASGETIKTIEALKKIKDIAVSVDVVVGQSNPYRERIKALCNTLPSMFFHCQVNHIAQLMAQADLAIGAGGTATWERCYLGLPSLVLIVADNQLQLTADVGRRGALINLGFSNEVSVGDLHEKICKYIKEPQTIKQVSQNALQLMGESTTSGAEKIVQILEKIHVGI